MGSSRMPGDLRAVFPPLSLQRLKDEPADDRALRLATELGKLPERISLNVAETQADRFAPLPFDLWWSAHSLHRSNSNIFRERKA